MKKKLACILSVLSVVALLCAVPASALSEPVYNSYTYDYWGEEVMAPDSYVPVRSVSAVDVGLLPLNEPSDLFVSANEDIYVVDKNNNRIVVFDSEYNLKKEVKEFKAGKSGAEVLTLNGPQGIYVDEDDNMYIADYNNHRAIKVNKKLEIVAEYLKPVADVAFSGIDFLPMHVVVDVRGFVYVHCQGIYQGAITYSDDGKFIGYFAGNAVAVGATEVLKNVWRNFMTEEQIAQMERSIPSEFTNLDINEEGFIFTCTANTVKNNVVKIDPTGEDIMKDNLLISSSYAVRYGDTRTRYYLGTTVQTSIIDVAYDEAGYVNCLDRQAGRVFQYSDETGDLICIFGGTGDQVGTGRTVAAIDTLGDKILVLDSQKRHFTVYEPTAYVDSIKKALALYDDGDVEGSMEEWQSVIKQNGNLQLAYSGIGKCYYVLGDYATAQTYFKLGDDRSGYEKALEHTRKEVIAVMLPFVIIGGVALYVLVKVLKLVKKHAKKKQQ